jgi:hypothetical protein
VVGLESSGQNTGDTVAISQNFLCNLQPYV